MKIDQNKIEEDRAATRYVKQNTAQKSIKHKQRKIAVWVKVKKRHIEYRQEGKENKREATRNKQKKIGNNIIKGINKTVRNENTENKHT